MIEKKYFYIHNISYWHGNNRVGNLINHIEAVRDTPLSKNQIGKNLIIISLIYDEEDKISDMLNFLESQTRNLDGPKVDILILPRYNSGGTARTMWEVYRFLDKNNITSEFFGTWEDDYIFAKDNFLDIVEEYLKKGNLFVGAIWTPPHITFRGEFGAPPTPEHNYEKMVKNGHKYVPPGSTLSFNTGLEAYKWCEDPYIMRYENLKKIENLIGRFTVAPQSRFVHWDHGVVHGEVGFPSRLSLAGGKFFGIKFDNIFKFLNHKSYVIH